MTIDLLYTGILQGLILALIAYAIMIPFRLLNFPDLTAEGAYPVGGAICTSLLLLSVHPILAIFIGSMAGGFMGFATGFIHLRLKVNTLLAGIILSTMMYSLNLRLLGQPNIALFDTSSVFSQRHILFNILFLLMIILMLIFSLLLFLQTEFGLKLRAVGLNKAFACQQNISVEKYTFLGLFLAGCFTGMAGGFLVELQHYMDVGMGVGIVIHALAALMIGEAIIGNNTVNKQIIAPFVGALVYQQIQGVVLSMGLAPSDLKFFTGALVLIVIAIQKKEKNACITRGKPLKKQLKT